MLDELGSALSLQNEPGIEEIEPGNVNKFDDIPYRTITERNYAIDK